MTTKPKAKRRGKNYKEETWLELLLVGAAALIVIASALLHL